jgi:hypothetical protein
MGRYAPVNASPAAGSTQEQKPSVTRPEGGRLRHPYRISHANSSQKPPHIPAARPSSQQKEVWQVPEGLKNVVDLRSEE